MNRIVRLPSKDETARAEANNKKAWFPQVGAWWVTNSGKTMLKLDMFPDTAFLLQTPKEKADPVDQTTEDF